VNTSFEKDLDRLMKRGGFPEPFLAETDLDASRWRKEYINGLVSEDVFTIDTVENLRSLLLVLRLLQARVGSPISYTSIAEDVNISPNTVKKYIGLFEALFIVFRVSPFSKNIARSIKKEPKIYFFDLGMLPDDPEQKFENLVALSLLAHTYRKQDWEGRELELAYIKNKEGKEVDFLLVENESPVELIESKYSDSNISPMLKYFSEKYSIPGKQIVYLLSNEYQTKNIQVLKAEKYLSTL
jgi:predicted AAA+ superfamily ATPase